MPDLVWTSSAVCPVCEGAAAAMESAEASRVIWCDHGHVSVEQPGYVAKQVFDFTKAKVYLLEKIKGVKRG